MKKLLTVLLAAVLLTMAAAPALANTITMYVDTPQHGTLTLRETESTDARALMRIPYKAAVEVIGIYGTWSEVRYDGLRGYVLSRYLSYTRPTGDAAVVPDTQINYKTFRHVSPYTAIVTASRPGGYVNLRWAPSKEIAVMDKIYDGSEVTVLSEGKGWYQVQDPETGYVGFMMSSFLR